MLGEESLAARGDADLLGVFPQVDLGVSSILALDAGGGGLGHVDHKYTFVQLIYFLFHRDDFELANLAVLLLNKTCPKLGLTNLTVLSLNKTCLNFDHSVI